MWPSPKKIDKNYPVVVFFTSFGSAGPCQRERFTGNGQQSVSVIDELTPTRTGPLFVSSREVYFSFAGSGEISRI